MLDSTWTKVGFRQSTGFQWESQALITQWLSALFQHEFSLNGKKCEIESTSLNNGFLMINLSENTYQWLSNDTIASASFHPCIYIFKFENSNDEINDNNSNKNNNPLQFSFTEDHYISSVQLLPKATLSSFLQIHSLKYSNKTKKDICSVIVKEFLKLVASVMDISDENLCKKLKISIGINQDESQFICPYRYNVRSYACHTELEFYNCLKDIDYQIIKKVFNSIHPCRKYNKSLAFFNGDIYNALHQSLQNRCYNIQFMNQNDIYSILDCYQISYLKSQ
jgi:hypothetical protein